MKYTHKAMSKKLLHVNARQKKCNKHSSGYLIGLCPYKIKTAPEISRSSRTLSKGRRHIEFYMDENEVVRDRLTVFTMAFAV